MWHRREKKRRPLDPTTNPTPPTPTRPRHTPSAAEWRSGEPHLMLRCLARLATDRRVEFHLTTSQVERKLRLFYCACCRLHWDALGEVARATVAVVERHPVGPGDRRAWAETRRSAASAERVALRAARRGPYSPERWNAAHLAGLLASAAEAHGELRRDLIRSGWPVGVAEQAAILREIFADPFDPVTLRPEWLTATVRGLAVAVRVGRAFDLMPVLGDALQDAGCDHAGILEHCYGATPHTLGCWVIDAVLGNG